MIDLVERLLFRSLDITGYVVVGTARRLKLI